MSRKQDKALFVRMSDKEWAVLEAALKLRYGTVDGMKSAFTRRVLMSASKEIIMDAVRERKRGV